MHVKGEQWRNIIKNYNNRAPTITNKGKQWFFFNENKIMQKLAKWKKHFQYFIFISLWIQSVYNYDLFSIVPCSTLFYFALQCAIIAFSFSLSLFSLILSFLLVYFVPLSCLFSCFCFAWNLNFIICISINIFIHSWWLRKATNLHLKFSYFFTEHNNKILSQFFMQVKTPFSLFKPFILNEKKKVKTLLFHFRSFL